jgi:hypothetical protein
MRTPAIFTILLMYIKTTAAWTRTDHWQLSLGTDYHGSHTTATYSVYPTASVSPTSTNTTTITATPYNELLNKQPISYAITVYNLFYAPSAPVCNVHGLNSCSPLSFNTASKTITTNYWAPVLVANPTPCTKTSFAYTTASSVFLPLETDVPDASSQAVGTDEAMLVTTYLKTLSTNLGGQAVTTSVVDVYLKSEAIMGVPASAEEYPLSQCVDPRQYSCSSLSSELAQGAGYIGTVVPTCQLSGQAYPPTTVTGGAISTPASGTAAASASKTGAASDLRVSTAVGSSSLVLVGFMVQLWLYY